MILHANPLITFLSILLMGAGLAACGRDDESGSPEDVQGGTQPPADQSAPPPPSAQAPAGMTGSEEQGELSAYESGNRSAGEVIDDSVITGKVKTALMSDEAIEGTSINVDTAQGVVTLTGVVEDQNQLNRALEIATQTEGVRSVNNRLSVGKPS